MFLISKQTGKMSPESRTLKFWFQSTNINHNIESQEQATAAQDFFRELMNPQDFPRGTSII